MNTDRICVPHVIPMSPTYRASRRLLAVFSAVGLFLLLNANPLAQSKLPAPASHVNDIAGVIDTHTKTRIEHVLQKLKEKSKFELYVTTVDTTGAQPISDFADQLARDWNIGARTSRDKSLLLVVSVASKTSFTRFSRPAQLAMPEGVLGEMTYRMQSPLSEGRFAEAVDSGVRVFATALAEKIGFNVADLEAQPVAVNTPEVASDSPQTILASTSAKQTTRPRTVSDGPKAVAEATPPAETPKTEPTPTETPAADPSPTESPSPEAVPVESPKLEAIPEPPKRETSTPVRKTSSTKTTAKPVRKTAAEIAEQDADESEEVELVLTKPLAQRPAILKTFLDTHPESKSRGRAIELLISTHAALGDQKLKNGDIAGGIEQLFRAIDEADVTISDQLFSGVISQIPMNLYLRGEKAAAMKAAQNVEAKFGTDPKRLLTVAGFYLGIESGSETVRVAEKAVSLAPDLAETHRILAVGLHISLRLDEAVGEYKRTLELDPTSKVSRGSLADLYRAAGKPEEALPLYNEQLTADAKDKAAHAGKVVSLLELDRADEANTALEAALAVEANNLPLLSGAAYWHVAHENYEKGFEFARKATSIEPRYTWAQIALVRSLIGLKRPLDAERAMRYARQYGKFPTLTYELANVLASMGLYDEANEVLRESFTIKDDQIHTYLAGHLPANDSGFLELLARERRAAIFQPKAADTAANAKLLKALLAFNTALTPSGGEKIKESIAVAAAQDFAAGSDTMRAFRQMYAASRLLRYGVGVEAALDFVAAARKASDEALKTHVLTLAVQADEFRELRARAISRGSVPDVAEAPHNVLASIYNGRLEDLQGWALFNQDKHTEAIAHLKQATDMLPKDTPAWRTAFWHLGAALEQSGQKEQALDAYITSYRGNAGDSVRRSVIEQLYKKINGSLTGLEERLGGFEAAAQPAATPEAPAETPKTESSSETATPTPEPTPAKTESSSQPMSEESMKSAASRLRSNVRITGRIVDADKTPIANVTVVLISPSGNVLAATTDNDGNYSFTVAPSQKTYRVIPSKDGFTFAPVDRAFSGLFEDQKEIDFVGSRP